MVPDKRFLILLASLLIGLPQVIMANDCQQIRQELEAEKDNPVKRYKLRKKLRKCEEAARTATQNPPAQQQPPAAYPGQYPSPPAAGYPYPSAGASAPYPAPDQGAPPPYPNQYPQQPAAGYPNQYPQQPPAGYPNPPNAVQPSYPAQYPGAPPAYPNQYPQQPAAGYPYPSNAVQPSYPAPPPAAPYPVQQPAMPVADPCEPLRKALGNDKSNLVLAYQLNRCIRKAEKAAQNK